jgi:Tfp pilus assembly protein PilO
VKRLLALGKKSDKRIGQSLIESGIITEDEIAQTLSNQYDIPFVSLDNVIIEPLERQCEDFERLQKKFMLVQSKLPSDQQLSSILKEFTKDKKGNSIDFMNVRPLPLEAENEFLTFPFRVDLEAPFF